jgi:hypothetical protein
VAQESVLAQQIVQRVRVRPPARRRLRRCDKADGVRIHTRFRIRF